MIERVEFRDDVKRYGSTVEEHCTKTQFVVPVVVQRQRIARTRARFAATSARRRSRSSSHREQGDRDAERIRSELRRIR